MRDDFGRVGWISLMGDSSRLFDFWFTTVYCGATDK